MPDPHPTPVRCPRCSRPQPRQRPDTIYWCDHCAAQFDDDPDEGGTFYNDPTKRLDRNHSR